MASSKQPKQPTFTVGAFGPKHHETDEYYSFRVHIWKDEETAEKEVFALERRMNSDLLEVTRYIEVSEEDKRDVTIEITNINSDWEVRDESQKSQRIPTSNVLHFPANSVTVDLKALESLVPHISNKYKSPYVNVAIYQNYQKRVSLSVKPRAPEGGIDEQLGVQ